MELIQNNPYRIAGILSNATAKELEKQRGKIRAFAKVGKEIKTDYDFHFLSEITRTEDLINKAFSNVEQNQDKVNFALFWFLNASPYDQIAIDYLKAGNSEKAIVKWEQVTINKEVNSKNFSAFNNLGTYKLLSQTQNDIKEGIEAKIKLIESEHFESFVHSVADETFTIDNKKQIEKLVDELLSQFKNKYSSSETLQLFSNCNGSTQNYLSKKFTEEPLHNIESQIESCKIKRKDRAKRTTKTWAEITTKKESDFPLTKRLIGRTYNYGLELYENSKEDLAILRELLGISNLKYKVAADQLANEIMQCGIDFFNDCQKEEITDNYIELSLELTKIASTIAVGKLTKDRTNSNIEGITDSLISKSLEQTVIKINKHLNNNSKSINMRIIHNIFCEGFITLLDLKTMTSSLKFNQNNALLKVGLEQMIVKLINNKLQSTTDYICHSTVVSSIEFLKFINSKIPSDKDSTQKIKNSIQSLNNLLDKLLSGVETSGNMDLISFHIERNILKKPAKNYYSIAEINKEITYYENQIKKNQLIQIKEEWEYQRIIQEFEKVKKWKLFRSSKQREEDIKNKEIELKNLLIKLEKERVNSIDRHLLYVKHSKELLKVIKNDL